METMSVPPALPRRVAGTPSKVAAASEYNEATVAGHFEAAGFSETEPVLLAGRHRDGLNGDQVYMHRDDRSNTGGSIVAQSELHQTLRDRRQGVRSVIPGIAVDIGFGPDSNMVRADTNLASVVVAARARAMDHRMNTSQEVSGKQRPSRNRLWSALGNFVTKLL